MPFYAIVNRFPVTPALDPLTLTLFALAFVATAIAVSRRPIFGAAILAFVPPFAFAHAVGGTTVTLGKVLLIATLVGIAGYGRHIALRRLPLTVLAAFAAIVIVDFITVAVAHYRFEALREALKWFEYLGFFTAVLVCYRLDPRPGAVRIALQSSVTLVALSALSDLFFGAHSSLNVAGHHLPRIAGVLEGPNQLGGYLEVAIAALGAWEVLRPTRIGAAILGLAGFVLALSFSRAALGDVLLIAVIFAIVQRPRVARLWPVLGGVAFGYLFTAIAGRGSGIGALLSATLGERTSDLDAAVSGGVGDRFELWRAAIALFVHHPLLGVGAGNYQYELGSVGLPGVRTEANNWYLQSLAEGGVVLLIAVVAWLASVFRALASAMGHSPWRLGAFAATCALALHGVTDDLTFYPKVAEPWIVLIALGIAAGPEPA